MSMMPGDKVETVNEFLMAPEEYRQAVEKIVKDSGQTFGESKKNPNFLQIKNKWW